MGKAVMFTITFFLLGTVLLALAFTIFGISQATEQRATEIAINNRVNDLSTSISKSFGDLFLETSGINISVINNTISIREFVPNPRISSYNQSFENFRSFIRSKEKYVTIDNYRINRTMLSIMPVNATYQSENKTRDPDDNEFRHVYNFVGVTNVTYYVYAPNAQIKRISWQNHNPGPVNVTAILQNGSKIIYDSRLADLKGDDVTLRVAFDLNTSDGDDIDFEVRDGNYLKIFDLRYNTIIGVDITFDTSEVLEVYMVNPITISVPEFNITKVTRSRLL